MDGAGFSVGTLETFNLSAGYHGKALIHDISLKLRPGKLNMLIGPNGSGKSTLLRVLARVIPPLSGEIKLDGMEFSKYHTKEIAKKLALLPQIRQTPSLSVATLAAQGRYPHHSYFSRLNTIDEGIINSALRLCQVEHLKERSLETLSGGERQRAYLAMTLVQDADIILLDEPTTFLDIAQQLEILEILKTLCEKGKTVLAVLHDISLALKYADTLFVLSEGKLMGEYAPDKLIESGKVEDVFGIKLHCFSNDTGNFVGFSPR